MRDRTGLHAYRQYEQSFNGGKIMDGAFKRAQFEYDHRLPTDEENVRGQGWLENGIEQLLMGGDVLFKRRLHAVQGVTFEQFAIAVDEFALERLSGCGTSPSVLGRLILAARQKAASQAASIAGELLGTPQPDETLRQIAAKLLTPHITEGLIAEDEDAEL